MSTAAGLFIFFALIVGYILYQLWWGRLKKRGMMHIRAKNQLQYNDIYEEEAAKKHAREEREHDTDH
jgi:hypothetical protein